MLPYTQESYELLHKGSLAMADIEANGIHIDVPYLKRQIEKITRRINHYTDLLRDSDIYNLWRKTYGQRANLGSRAQLTHILFNVFGMKAPIDRTASGRIKADESALVRLNNPFVKHWIETEKLKKLLATNLRGLLAETIDGYLHPFFNLHTTRTFRSSSSDINFQNVPRKEPKHAEIIRGAFIPRPGRFLVETDIKGAEVCISACYNKDPKLIEYINDETKDMHRDVALECFLLKLNEITKPIRDSAKSNFTFAQFYGDWYVDCARRLWDDVIQTDNLKLASGRLLREHLAAKGIKFLGALNPKEEPAPGTFEYLIKKVEHSFWYDRFSVYRQWKEDWFKAYQARGYFRTLTGFICSGIMDRKDAVNYPIQGSAFHCLLWSLIEINRRLKIYKMKTLLVGQIHDSILADVVPEEYKSYKEIVIDVMTQRLQKHWPWIIVPIRIEFDKTDVDMPWSTKHGDEN